MQNGMKRGDLALRTGMIMLIYFWACASSVSGAPSTWTLPRQLPTAPAVCQTKIRAAIDKHDQDWLAHGAENKTALEESAWQDAVIIDILDDFCANWPGRDAEREYWVGQYDKDLKYCSDNYGEPCALKLFNGPVYVRHSSATPRPSAGTDDASRQHATPVAEPEQSGTPVASASTPASGDVFNQCVDLLDLGQSGIQHMWQLRNVCGQTIKVAYCFRETFAAAGDTNMCADQEYDHRTIAPAASFDFPFSPLPEGTAMSDGRVVKNNRFEVAGTACSNGSAPSVYFEYGRMIFQHC
jgi:hypothetical protein